jgi:hypothetical protein
MLKYTFIITIAILSMLLVCFVVVFIRGYIDSN